MRLPFFIPAVSILCFLNALSGCAAGPPARDHEVSVAVFGDPGQPLADVEISHGARPVGRTGDDGVLRLSLRGAEGRAVALDVHCPEGYRSPSQPLAIVLRRLAEDDLHPEWRAYCEPLLRTLVIAVRAEHGPNLPVSMLGREVGRTDALGAAHVLVRSPPDESVELVLDTSASPGLRPQNPSARFEVPAHDDVALLSQHFDAPRPIAVSHRRPRIVRIGAR